MLIICQIDWREVGVSFELQCLRNCTLSSYCYNDGTFTTSACVKTVQSVVVTRDVHIFMISYIGLLC